jgi:hypothetical protein
MTMRPARISATIVGTCRLAGDPLARAVVERRAAVQRRGDLHAHPGPAALHAREKADVQLARGVAPVAADHVDVDSSGAKASEAGTGHARVRVLDGRHHARDARRDQRVAARRRAPVVRAGLERDDGSGAARVAAGLAGQAQGMHLGVFTAGLLRVAGGKHFAACRQQHAAHARIGVAQADGARRGLQGDLARGGFGDKCRHGRWWLVTADAAPWWRQCSGRPPVACHPRGMSGVRATSRKFWCSSVVAASSHAYGCSSLSIDSTRWASALNTEPLPLWSEE